MFSLLAMSNWTKCQLFTPHALLCISGLNLIILEQIPFLPFHQLYLFSCPFHFLPLHQDELKKLYSQLEVAKNKKMANSNPHISKKQGSRFGIGRSIMKRIADFPETLSRQHSREDGSATRSRSPSLFSAPQGSPLR